MRTLGRSCPAHAGARPPQSMASTSMATSPSDRFPKPMSVIMFPPIRFFQQPTKMRNARFPNDTNNKTVLRSPCLPHFTPVANGGDYPLPAGKSVGGKASRAALPSHGLPKSKGERRPGLLDLEKVQRETWTRRNIPTGIAVGGGKQLPNRCLHQFGPRLLPG